jgi:hypothetical protein
MANRRMLARNISTSVKVNRLTDFEALLYTWMIPWLDDYGQIEGEPEVIRAQIFPMRKTTDRKIGAALGRMSDLGLIRWHLTDGKIVIQQTQFEDFQTNLHKRTASKLPSWGNESVPITSQNFPEFLGFTDTTELNRTELKGTEGKGTEGAKGSAPKLSFSDFVTLTEKEHQSLIAKHGQVLTDRCIETLNNHKGATGKEYKSDYHAILKWVVDATTKPTNGQAPNPGYDYQKKADACYSREPEESKDNPNVCRGTSGPYCKLCAKNRVAEIKGVEA